MAKFKGGEITDRDFTEAVDNLSPRVRAVALSQRREFLESYVIEKLLLREAEKKGVQHLDEVQSLMEKAREKILVAKLIEMEIESKVKVTPEDAKNYYDANKEEFMTPYRVKASHILLRSREEAEQVRTQAEAGGDFAELAKKHSLDPTAAKGGDLGYFQKGQLIPEIEEAAFAMGKGDTSGVIETAFGFHLIRVDDVAQPQSREYAAVEKEITDKIAVEEKSRLFGRLTERLKGKAGISIDEKRLSEISLKNEN